MDIHRSNEEKTPKSIYAVSFHLEYQWNNLHRFIQILQNPVG